MILDSQNLLNIRNTQTIKEIRREIINIKIN